MLLAACGDDEQVTDPVDNDSQEQPANSKSGLDQDSIGDKTFGFTEFDVNVDYPVIDDEIEVNYEENREKVEAEYKTQMTKTNLAGNDAIAEIEVEVTYPDGIKKEYKQISRLNSQLLSVPENHSLMRMIFLIIRFHVSSRKWSVFFETQIFHRQIVLYYPFRHPAALL